MYKRISLRGQKINKYLKEISEKVQKSLIKRLKQITQIKFSSLKISVIVNNLRNQRSLRFFQRPLKELKQVIDDFRFKIITGIYIDNEKMIKLVQLKNTSSGLRVSKIILKEIDYGKAQTEKEREEVLVNTLKEIAQNDKISSRNLVTAIPRHLSIVRYIILPSTDEKEIKQMMEFEVEKHIPFAIDKVERGFQIISKADNESKVILIAVKKETIDKYLSWFSKANLIPEIIDISSFATFNSFVNSDYTTGNVGVTALVDAGQTTAEIGIVCENLLYFTRSILFNTKKNSWIEELLSEIKRSINVFRIESHNQEIDRMVLGGEKLDDIKRVLQEELNLIVKTATPFKEIQLASYVNEKEGLNSAMSIPMGLALRKVITNKIEVNLLPEEVIKQRQAQKKRKALKLWGFFTSLVAICLITFASWIFLSREAGLKELDRKIAEVKPGVIRVEKIQSQIQLLTYFTENQSQCLDILRELSLSSVIPEDAYFTDLVFRKNKSVYLRGMTLSHSVVSQIVANLENLVYFKNVERSFSRANRIGNRDVVEFEIKCPLMNDK